MRPEFENANCGPGWHGILERLSGEIDKLNLPPEFRVLQIKEKFGELRVYVEGAGPFSKIVELLIRDAARESLETCEFCGKPGHRRPLSWVKTLCDLCYAREEPI